jgi:hypothetical protein
MNDDSRICRGWATRDAQRWSRKADRLRHLARGPVLAWLALPSAQKIRATVKVIGGPVYTAHQVDRFHTGRSRRDIQRFVHGMVSSRR